MTSLYHVAAEFRAQAAKLADMDLPPEVLADTLEGMSGEVEAKAIACGHVIRSLEAEAEAEKAWAKRAAEHAKSLEARAERLREYVAAQLKACGIDKVSEPGMALSFRKSEAVIITDAGVLPPDMMAPPKPQEADKAKIKAAFKAGRVVPGAALETRSTLQVK